jgi:hypothetical protein
VRWIRFLLPGFGVVLFLSSAVAGPGDNLDVRFVIYATSRDSSSQIGPCNGDRDPISQNIPCSNYVTTWPVVDGWSSVPWVYLLAAQGGSAGMQGASFGINYTPGSGPGDGISEYFMTVSEGLWQLCNDGLPFPSTDPAWPHPGSGMLMTWSTCQNTEVGSDGVHMLIASLYVVAYSDDTLELTPNYTRPSGPELGVYECLYNQTFTNLLDYTAPSLQPFLTGKLQFGAGRPGVPGYNPCGVVATEPTTWGRVKTLFDEGDR